VSEPSTDFYAVEDLLEPEEIEIRDRVRAFCDKEVTPHINEYWERAEFPFELVPKIAELGISGGTVEGYGSPGMSAVAAGLVAAEWARADGSVGTFYGVHSFLAMQSIALLGNEEQRERWLPAMARMEKIGAFGLTQPQHGSDAVGLETSARRDGDSFVLNGRKKWIGNGSIADYVIIALRGRLLLNLDHREGVPDWSTFHIEGPRSRPQAEPPPVTTTAGLSAPRLTSWRASSPRRRYRRRALRRPAFRLSPSRARGHRPCAGRAAGRGRRTADFGGPWRVLWAGQWAAAYARRTVSGTRPRLPIS
jgi:alkylation response protein AidB-like acyl-CoA dehydrogenase